MNEPTPMPTHLEFTLEQWDEIQAGWRRTISALVRLVIGVLMVVALGVGFLGWRSYQAETDRRDSQDRSECITRTEAVALGRLVDALKGQPGDPTRNAKLTAAAGELAKLQDVGRTCGG